MDKIIHFKVTEGWMPQMQERQLRGVLSQMDEVEITIRKPRTKRSNEQNAFLHVICRLLKDGLNELGNNYNEVTVKSIVKYKFLLVTEVNQNTGETFERIKDTSELSVEEMKVFIEQIIYFAAELGIILPTEEQNI